ncbi:MAG: 50S ribosomal protein L24 [Crenarchaeota archaeon]|jgi:large subunit ribosomal protein L24|nr:50S ribosomal protein L24 [Thermoproteota archaeon]
MQKTKNPGKQRKMLHNAPAHIRQKIMAAPLSSELSASRGAKTLPVRKGDTVRILRGDNKGFEGKISRVDRKMYRIYLEGLTREKVDGTNIFLSVHPSKVQIRNLNLDDKYRKDIVLGRKKAPEKKEKTKATPAKAIKAPAKAAKQETASKAKKATAKKTAVKKTEGATSEEGGQ